MARVEPEALAELERGIRTWSAAGEHLHRRASAAVQRHLHDVERHVARLSARVQQIESELAAAKGELRARLQRELREVSRALEQARRARHLVQNADRRARALSLRVSEATTRRAPQAASALTRKQLALAEYEAASVAGSAPSSPSGSVSGLAGGRALARMVGVALVGGAEDTFEQTADQLTAHMPDRVGDPLSVAVPLAREIQSNWETYRLTPEFIAMGVGRLLGRGR